MNLEKFTDRAKGLVKAAQSVALRANHQRLTPFLMICVKGISSLYKNVLALLLILSTIEQSTSFQHRHITTPQRAQREITQLLRQDCQLVYYQFFPFTDLPPKTQTQITDQSSPVAFPRQYPGIPLTLRWSVAQLLMMSFAANDASILAWSSSRLARLRDIARPAP